MSVRLRGSIDGQVAPGVAGCVDDLHHPVGTQADLLAAGERHVQRGAVAVGADARLAFLPIADPVVSLELGIAPPDQRFGVTHPGRVQGMAHERRLGRGGLHPRVPALMVHVRVGDDNIAQFCQFQADLAQIGQDFLLRVVGAARVHQHGRVLPHQEVDVDHAVDPKRAFDAMNARCNFHDWAPYRLS